MSANAPSSQKLDQIYYRNASPEMQAALLAALTSDTPVCFTADEWRIHGPEAERQHAAKDISDALNAAVAVLKAMPQDAYDKTATDKMPISYSIIAAHVGRALDRYKHLGACESWPRALLSSFAEVAYNARRGDRPTYMQYQDMLEDAVRNAGQAPVKYTLSPIEKWLATACQPSDFPPLLARAEMERAACHPASPRRPYLNALHDVVAIMIKRIDEGCFTQNYPIDVTLQPLHTAILFRTKSHIGQHFVMTTPPVA